MKDDWVEVPARTRGDRKKRERDGDDNDNDDGGDEVVYHPPSPQPFQPFVLILVGIPGSGKSNFATQLETSMPEKFVRVNQDTLKTRRKCEAMTLRALAQGKVAVIDRCNFNIEQRKTWIDIARNRHVKCECVVFQGEVDDCITRCKQRRNHETVHPSKAAGVVSLVARQFRPPILRGGNNNGGRVECKGGEHFHRLERVSSFRMANDLVSDYLI